MLRLLRRTSVTTPPPANLPWSRQRLLAALAGVLAGVVALIAGLGFAVYFALTGAATTASSDSDHRASTGAQRNETARRDQIAAAPMLDVDATAARPSDPAATPGPAITIPDPTGTGPAGVPSGFPRTPAGAVGQLAAIEQTVLQTMSIPTTSEVYQAWALPGAVPQPQWELTRSVQMFLGAAQMGNTMDPSAAVVITPVGAQIKGSDGGDWSLACVLVTATASGTKTAKAAYGHCERMQWKTGAGGGRWMIGPGAAPAQAPSTWPGTDLAAKAGWKTWVTTPSGGDS